ncbi:hypothetical protein NKR23_g1378 [Pleurostoma richardsiae]|uniref:Uncharacterized protein n=1 Tax=Pleurostoma richardsiae TaxID=41990 RepID=A0AA38RQ46_9PEZI|nr:hypothetical protein NKR23_g1378 [Pleurostoma richardsiae]
MTSLYHRDSYFTSPHPASFYALQAADFSSFISTQLLPASMSGEGKADDAESSAASQKRRSSQESAVAMALEVARETPEGAQDPTVVGILEAALSATWDKVVKQSDYVMTPGEFAVFNFFQHRFAGNQDAIAARKRYWDNTHA